MPHRAVSPAASENEFDLAKAWFPDEDESRLGNVSTFTQNGSRSLGVDAEMGGDDEDEDGDEEFIAAQLAASNRKSSNLKGRSVKKGGGFQAMGLNANLLKAITRKGFSVPTPIQRKTIPLVLDGQDVVGMARTGSGKTAAFVVPMIEKLKAHSAKVGSRALIMSPSRELALQTLKVVKEFSRGTDLRSVLLVGGDSLEEQFQFMSSNPDIVIATPGRFLHLKVEMSLDLSSYRYVVFDEADRLFEMGFATQLAEILHALPSSRQTLLFSATLPKSLVEFAKAGLQDPSLIRLDAETKVSPDLQSAFFTIKSAEKEGALLHILHDVIKMPTGMTEAAQRQVQEEKKQSKKRKRDDDRPRGSDSPTPHSTIVFAATKHHVEYLATLLRESGFAVSHVYGSLDQTARKFQVQDFRSGLSNVLVVTDVAARGIDIPILANVINYDFPPQPKIYVHRVGRTARAGRTGWSYSLVSETDAPYLLDLQLFLGRKLVFGVDVSQDWTFASDVVVGGMIRDKVERNLEFVTKLLDESSDLALLRSVATKGEKLYLRTRNSASAESAKRSREVVASEGWRTLNPLFKDEVDSVEVERAKMLARVSGFRPQETVFEIGKRGAAGTTGELAELLRKRREKILAPKRTTNDEREQMVSDQARMGGKETQTSSYEDSSSAVEAQSEDELEVTLSHPSANDQADPSSSWKDTENFMSYTPTASNVAEERGYGVHSGSYNTASQSSNFIQAAQGVTMDFNNDDGAKSFAEPSKARGMRWDKKSKKYVARANDIDGSRGAKVIKGESGQKIAASFRSGRFDAWRKSNKIDRLPRVGEAESSTQQHQHFGRRYKHNKELAPKQADKYRDDYHSRKKRVEEAKEKRIGKFKEGSGKNELKGVDDIRKDRKLKEKRREKNARPSKKRKF